MEKISIIVPVYKVEPYLRQCIDSILAQTYRHFELILIDDGSPDRCGEICEEYAAKDSRIVVLHQANGGLSAARNAGIDWVFSNSDSPWLTFVDSDDALAPIMLETLYKAATESQADIAVTHGATFSDDTQLEHEGKKVGAATLYTGKDLLEAFYGKEDVLSVVSWGKLFRKDLFRELRFPHGKIHEDEATTPILLFRSEKVVIVRSWLYYYRQREGSIMQTDFSVKRFDIIDALDGCASYFEVQQDKSLAQAARRHHLHAWARLTFTARQAGVYRQVPAQYRMSILRAGGIIFVSSLRSGGIQFVTKRIRNLIGQLKH